MIFYRNNRLNSSSKTSFGIGANQFEKACLERGVTPKQTAVFKAMAEGKGNKQIATDLKLSVHTVRAHIRDIFRILRVNSRIEALNEVREGKASDSQAERNPEESGLGLP